MFELPPASHPADGPESEKKWQNCPTCDNFLSEQHWNAEKENPGDWGKSGNCFVGKDLNLQQSPRTWVGEGTQDMYVHTYIHTYIHILIYTYIPYHTIPLHYIPYHYITYHYITLHYITLHCIALHCIALHYITLHYITYIHTYILICRYHYLPRARMTSIFEGQPPKTRPKLQPNKMVIWVPVYIYINIHIYQSKKRNPMVESWLTPKNHIIYRFRDQKLP